MTVPDFMLGLLSLTNLVMGIGVWRLSMSNVSVTTRLGAVEDQLRALANS